jgi:Cu2+-exporting ATPase
MYNLTFQHLSNWFTSTSHTIPDSDAEQHQHCHHAHCDHAHFHTEKHFNKSIIGLTYGLLQFAFASSSPLFMVINALVTIYLGLNVYRSAWHALKEKKIVMTTLYSISTLSILAVSISSLIFPWLPMMSETAPLILGFWHLGEFLENQMVNKINHQLDVRDCLEPVVVKKGELLKTPIQHLKPSDKIILSAGHVIPVDGVLSNGAFLFTTRVDGSPEAKWFPAGSEVKSGMTLSHFNSKIEITVTKSYEDSYLSLVAKNINRAHQEKAPIEQLADKVLSYFIPALVSIAILSGIIIHHFFGPALAIQCVISVLVSACPCALSLITPMAVKIGMSKASEHGVVFKNSKDLQAAATIDHVVFDLNGTLTEGRISISNLHVTDERYLSVIDALESHANHPVSDSICSYIKQLPSFAPQAIEFEEIDNSHHSGIRGKIGADWLMIGNTEMLKDHQIPFYLNPNSRPYSLYIVLNQTIIGHIETEDPLRVDAVETVQKMKELGKTIHICTGASQGDAEKYAAVLGIETTHICANTVGAASDLLKRTKTDYIQQLQQQGYHVAMVGDAANDIAAISSANIGIAVHSEIGDKLTTELASIVIQKGHLLPIVTALDVAQKTSHNIFQNLMVSLGYNTCITLVAAGLFLSAGFALNPVLGVLLMIMESSIVFANLYRFKYQEIIHAATDNVSHTNHSFFNSHHDCCGHHSPTLAP